MPTAGRSQVRAMRLGLGPSLDHSKYEQLRASRLRREIKPGSAEPGGHLATVATACDKGGVEEKSSAGGTSSKSRSRAELGCKSIADSFVTFSFSRKHVQDFRSSSSPPFSDSPAKEQQEWTGEFCESFPQVVAPNAQQHIGFPMSSAKKRARSCFMMTTADVIGL